MKKLLFLILTCLTLYSCTNTPIKNTYYVNSNNGNDTNDGKSPETAWQTLSHASKTTLKPGESLLLSSGCTFNGSLKINGTGTINEPITVSSYHQGNTTMPIIDARGYEAAIKIENGSYIEVSNLELTADAGEVMEEAARKSRFGVLIESNEEGLYPGFELKNLLIHHIFATENIKKDGQNPSSNMGTGIKIQMGKPGAQIRDILIENCKLEQTGHTGIRIFGNGKSYIKNISILNNELLHIGGPGMVPGLCDSVLVQGNVVNYSGSSIDPRMHNRGSGIWPWTSNNVLIEKNKFMNAWGKMDSYGVHIDFNCSNVVVQYNLSVNNAGGFVEILGNDYNCCYRYNISVNDGYRQKGVDGVTHDGKILWTSGYVGNNEQRKGPFNSYIYNNTIFVKESYPARFSFTKTTDGLLIANNVFYILGKPTDVNDHEKKGTKNKQIKNVVFKNNLYQKLGLIPESVIVRDLAPLIGNPEFKNPGGFNPEDYIPQNIEAIKDKGITIEKLPGDPVGLKIGLKVEHDFLGNPIVGLPDIGAIEIK